MKNYAKGDEFEVPISPRLLGGFGGHSKDKMGWATPYIEQLKQGKTVQFRPRGNSMAGKVESGQLVTVAPLTAAPKPGDVVLCRVNGNQYLHLVKAVRGQQFQIGNNKGRINGWTSRQNIFGIVVKVG